MKKIKYGDKTLDMPEGMTLEQAKAQMARFFPELAEPEVKTEKKNDDTIYIFSKKAGRKGSLPLPVIHTQCYVCGISIDCKPEDAIAYNEENQTPVFLCQKCDPSCNNEDDNIESDESQR